MRYVSDKDECAGVNKCHVKAQCTNTEGSYTCSCLDGYAGNGKNCTGKDLCAVRIVKLSCSLVKLFKRYGVTVVFLALKDFC